RAGPIHHGGDLGLVARIGDHIGRTIVFAEHGPDVIGIGFAVSVRRAVIAFARAESGERSRRRHARRSQGNIFEARDGDGVEAVAGELLAIAAEHEVPLFRAHAFALAAPAVMFQPRARHQHSLAFWFVLNGSSPEGLRDPCQTIRSRHTTKKSRHSGALANSERTRNPEVVERDAQLVAQNSGFALTRAPE